MPIESAPAISVKSLLAHMVHRGDGLLIFDWIKQGPGMTERRYELKHPGLVPPSDFITRSLHCAYGTMEKADEKQFKESYVLDVAIFDRIVYHVPLAAIPERGVLFPWAVDSQIPQPGEFTTAWYIPPMVPFSIILRGDPVNVKSLSFLPVINGVMDRAIQ